MAWRHRCLSVKMSFHLIDFIKTYPHGTCSMQQGYCVHALCCTHVYAPVHITWRAMTDATAESTGSIGRSSSKHTHMQARFQHSC